MLPVGRHSNTKLLQWLCHLSIVSEHIVVKLFYSRMIQIDILCSNAKCCGIKRQCDKDSLSTKIIILFNNTVLPLHIPFSAWDKIQNNQNFVENCHQFLNATIFNIFNLILFLGF